MKTSVKRLPDAELDVMQAMWDCNVPVLRSDLEAILNESHPMALTTLLTLLNRLSDKGFIRIEKVGRASQYYPLVTKEEYLAEQSHRFLHQLCQGNVSTFASALVSGGLSKEDIEELRALLKEKL